MEKQNKVKEKTKKKTSIRKEVTDSSKRPLAFLRASLSKYSECLSRL